MSQLHGKQLKVNSTSLDRLNGTGIVALASGAEMNFQTGSKLRYADAPVQATEVANKAYVDSVASGLDVKQAAQLISVSDVSGTYNAGVISGVATSLSIDGISVSNGARVVLNGQTDPAHNGIYVYDNAGTLTRSEDFNDPAEVNGGEFVFIKEGNAYADTGWVVSTPNGTITIGTDDIVFTQFSAAFNLLAGDGLVQDGNTFDVNTGTGLTISFDAVAIANTGVSATSYGSATAVATFTVNAQGQLTTAATTPISIPSGQVNNFTASVTQIVNSEVFDAANFLDSTTIDFQVTAGATVSAVIKSASISEDLLNVTNTPTTGYVLAATGSGQFVWVDPAATGDITEVLAGDGLTGGGQSGSVTLSLDSTAAGNGLTFSSGVLSVDLATNSGLTLTGGDLAVNPTIAGNGLTYLNGQLSVVTVAQAQPKYLVSTGNILDGAGVSLAAASINDFSRVQAFINGLEVSIGASGGVVVAGLPNISNESIEYNGTRFVWTGQAGYSLEATDDVRIVYEA